MTSTAEQVERRHVEARAPEEREVFLERALASARGQAIAVLVPAPVAAPEALLGDRLEEHAYVWADNLAGFGATRLLEAGGATRFLELAARGRAIWPALETHVHPALGAELVRLARPRMFGGFAFEDSLAHRASSGTWSGFGAASFTLPRWSYATDGGGAALALVIDRDEAADRSGRTRILAELSALSARLAGSQGAAAMPAAIAELTDPAPAEWALELDAIGRAIEIGHVRKVVAARRTTVLADAAWPQRELIARLRNVNGTRFAFHRDGAVFLGVTPERLVSKHGARADVEAVAGTAATATGAGDALGSEKIAEEHAIVVRFLRRRLARFAVELDVPPEPHVRRLGHLAHLVTPIAARVRSDVHVLELAAALHPTPAVAGAPQHEAVRWLEAHEPARGWYAGAIGWFDATGDGELRVALRSGLVRDRAAILFAGAGIVAGSSAIEEYRETRLKERTLREALGVEP